MLEKGGGGIQDIQIIAIQNRYSKVVCQNIFCLRINDYPKLNKIQPGFGAELIDSLSDSRLKIIGQLDHSGNCGSVSVYCHLVACILLAVAVWIIRGGWIHMMIQSLNYLAIQIMPGRAVSQWQALCCMDENVHNFVTTQTKFEFNLMIQIDTKLS